MISQKITADNNNKRKFLTNEFHEIPASLIIPPKQPQLSSIPSKIPQSIVQVKIKNKKEDNK